jgi:tetratricopeptide (TPR) repeat protein
MKLADVSLLKTLTQGPEARALEKARSLSGEGRLDKAVAALEAGLARSPDSEPLLFELSRCLLTAGRETDAGECVKKVLRRHPAHIDAVQEFIEEVKMKGREVGTYYDAVAEHYIRVEDFARALDALERIPPEQLRVYHGRQVAKWDAVRKNAPAAKLTKTSLHSAYYVALSLERVGDYEKASQAYRSLIEKNPEETGKICARFGAILARDYQNLRLRMGLIDLLLQAGKIDEALSQMEQAMEADATAAAPALAARLDTCLENQPGRAEPLWLLARARCAEGKYPEMLAALTALAGLGSHTDKIIHLLEDLTPKMDENPSLRLALADAYVAAKKPVLAVESILLAMEKIGDDKTAAALEKVVTAFPDHSRAFLMLGELDFKAGRTARGVERYERVLSLSPDDGPILVPKLLALLEQGGPSGAAPLCDSLARILLRQGERSRAALLLRYRALLDPRGAAEGAALIREALSSDPSHGGLRLALAECLSASGNPEQAVPALEQLLKEDPGRAAEGMHALSAAARSSPEAARAALPVFRDLASRGVEPAAARFGQGEAALAAGEVGEAVHALSEVATQAPARMKEIQETFEALLARHPETTEVRYILAGLYLDRKEYASAMGELKKIQSLNEDLLSPLLARYRAALSASPEDVEVRLGLSAALLLSRQFEQVQILGAETLRIRDDETTAPLQLDLGDASLEKGDAVAAVKRYYNAFRKNISLAARAASKLDAVLHLHPNLSLASLALGKILPETGRVAEGVEHLLEAFRGDPRISEGVLTELDRIRASHPVSPEAAAARVEILFAQGNDRGATEAISALLESRPDSARNMIPRIEAILARSPRLAPAHLAMSKAQRALKDASRAAESCRSAYRLDKGCAPQVIRSCSEMIAEDPKSPLAYLTLAEIYLADDEIAAAAEKLFQAASRTEGPQDEVLKVLEALSAKDSGTARVAFLSAEILARSGRLAAAVRAYRKALERDPGLLEAALKGYQILLEKDPQLGEARLARAQALVLRQEFAPALEELEGALRATPGAAREILDEALTLRQRWPGSYRLVTLITDLLMTGERLPEAAGILQEELQGSREPMERLSLLVRLWRIRLARGESGEARKLIAEAAKLAPDRDRLFARIHESIVAQVRSEVGSLRERARSGSCVGPEMKRLALGLLTLGETGEALEIAATSPGVMEASDLLRIHSEAALQDSDYFRAAEILKSLGPDRRLAFAAERSGDFVLACRTLEQLDAAGHDPGIRSALLRAYRHLVLRDLEPGRQKLVGETVVRFGT